MFFPQETNRAATIWSHKAYLIACLYGLSAFSKFQLTSSHIQMQKILQNKIEKLSKIEMVAKLLEDDIIKNQPIATALVSYKNKRCTYSCICKLLPFIIILWIDMIKFPEHLEQQP